MFRDRQYLNQLLQIALPIAAQGLITSALNATGVLLIGQLGEVSVAAVGLGNQIFFLFNLMMFGVVSGSAIFTAQYWGSGDLAGIRRVTGLCLLLALGAGSLFTVVALIFPGAAMSLYTSDPKVIELGKQYLQIIGFSYLVTGITFVFGGQLRATGQVRVPVLISMVALSIGTALNYIFIFGLFGLPVLGVRGAALGTCIARLGECAALLFFTYRTRQATAVRPSDLRRLEPAFLKCYWTTVLPVAANETVWSMGISIYNVIYARIGTDAIAGVNIASTIEGLFFVVYMGISNATAILVGNRIGAGENDKAVLYARRTLILIVGLALIGGAGLILISGWVVGFYRISPAAAENARLVMIVLGCAQWVRAANGAIIVGILRSGGDTRFSLVIDVGSVWLVGIPMALLGAFVFKLPVYWVVALVMADELAKFTGGMYRYLSKKWLNNLTRLPVVNPPECLPPDAAAGA